MALICSHNCLPAFRCCQLTCRAERHNELMTKDNRTYCARLKKKKKNHNESENHFFTLLKEKMLSPLLCCQINRNIKLMCCPAVRLCGLSLFLTQLTLQLYITLRNYILVIDTFVFCLLVTVTLCLTEQE